MGGHATVLENLHPPATVATRVMGEPELQKVQGDWVPAALALVAVVGHAASSCSSASSRPSASST